MPEPSPRTDAEPMAFTADEFLRGTVAAWLAFNLLFTGMLAIEGRRPRAPRPDPDAAAQDFRAR